MIERIRAFFFTFRKLRLRNHDFSIIANNCIGGCVLHDFGQPFSTPTINLYIECPDYIEMLKNLKYYMNAELTEVPSSESFPIGLLGGGVKLYFLHYKTFSEAKEAWNRRRKRIHWDNLYVILGEKNGCTYEDLKEFDKLPFKHKVALTHIEYPEIKSAYYIRGYEDKSELGIIMDFVGKFGKRVYDQFDWLNFLNQK